MSRKALDVATKGLDPTLKGDLKPRICPACSNDGPHVRLIEVQAQTQAAVSVQTARKWLKRGFKFDELCAHIDQVIAEVPKDERLPFRLSDYREPL